MDFNKIFIKGACPTKVGGQAVMEGIMMKGPKKDATVVRCPDGRMRIRIRPVKPRKGLAKVPFLRGVFVFLDSLIEGTKTLMYSADVLERYAQDEDGAESEPEEESRFFAWLEKHFGERAAWNLMIYSSVLLAVLITVVVFILAPTWLVDLCRHFTESAVLLNLIEGLFRILMFVVYVLAISRMKEIHTVFQFHGAEHECIHCFENGLELTPENCQQFETLHPRCGTSFLMFVFVIALLLFSLLGWPNLWVRLLSRLLLLPVIAGLSFELLQWAGRSDNWIVKILSLPGLGLQKITTAKPGVRELEVAIAAMKPVLSEEGPASFEGFTDMSGALWTEEEEAGEETITCL